MSTLRHLRILVLPALLVAAKSLAQCPQLYDHNGVPSSSPQWFSCSGTSYTLLIASPQSIGAYTIDWGDGSPIHSGTVLAPPLTVSHVYGSTVATYTVTFTVPGPGCVITGTLTVEQSTSASIQIPVGGLTQICAPQAVEFINSSTNTSPNTVFTWDFGDGSPLQVFNYTNLGQTLSHTYLPGTVGCETTVRLFAENTCNTLQGGASLATFNPIRIWDLDTADITPSETLLCYPDTVVTFLNTTRRNCLLQGNIYQRFEYWNFGDYWGTGQDSILDWTPWPPTFPRTIAYPGIGTYTAMLLDSNYCGIDTAYVTITIVPPPSVTIIATPNPVCAGATVLFTQTTTGGANLFEWNFGLGAGWQTTGPGNQSRTYNTPGTYTIQCRVTIAGATPGCTSTASVTITVLPSPVAQFTATPLQACDSLTATFTNTSVGAATYLWDFGDGTTSTLTVPPPHHYGSPGAYNVTLTAYTALGCSHTTAQIIRVHAPPMVQVIASNLCEGDVAAFTPQVIPSPGDAVTGYSWDLGDGTSSTLQNPTHQYAAIGPYTVVLNVSTAYCTGTASQPIVVQPKPVASFTPSPLLGCSPLVVTISNSSVGASLWSWDFGDGTMSAAFQPAHTYLNAGPGNLSRTITLIASTPFGCHDTATAVVQVAPGAVADFVHNAVPGCAPLDVSFTNQSTGADSYLWDMGDGNTSTDEHPAHTFVNNTLVVQTYVVQLVAISAAGCSDTTTQLIVVQPAADFTFIGTPPAGCTPHIVTLPNVLGAVVYTWDLGDGTTSNSPMPTHTYTNTTLADITYPVTLIAMNAFGCIDTLSTQVLVHPLPVAQFSPSIMQGCQPLSVTFVDQNFGAQSLFWDLGDGTTSSGAPGDITHVFTHSATAPVTFNVGQVATSPFGCLDTTVVPIEVYPPVNAAFTVPAEACSPFLVPVTNLSTGASVYQWNMGDGTVLNGSAPLHIYTNNGITPVSFTITLTATSPYGCVSTTQQSVLVHPVPSASFTAAPFFQQWPDATVGLINTSGAGTWSYLWSMGDGTTSNLITPGAHTYSTWGQYTITLIVMGSQCSDTAVQVVEIGPPLPTASFQGAGEGCAPLTVQFTNTSLLGLSYLWSFGDGGTSTADNPTYVYNTPGTYTVMLTALGVGGGVNVVVKVDSVVVHPNAAAFFVLQPGAVVAPSEPVFAYNLSNGASSYVWDFGDGATYSTFNAIHYYTQAGTFDVMLVANNQWNCPDTFLIPAAVTATLGGDIAFPNAFTPGNGGPSGGVYDPQSFTNDIFFPVYKGVEEYHLQIFNRWGELVFESTDVRRGWDGYYRGNPAKQDVYAWKAFARFSDGRERIMSGDVTLLR